MYLRSLWSRYVKSSNSFFLLLCSCYYLVLPLEVTNSLYFSHEAALFLSNVWLMVTESVNIWSYLYQLILLQQSGLKVVVVGVVVVVVVYLVVDLFIQITKTYPLFHIQCDQKGLGWSENLFCLTLFTINIEFPQKTKYTIHTILLFTSQ